MAARCKVIVISEVSFQHRGRVCIGHIVIWQQMASPFFTQPHKIVLGIYIHGNFAGFLTYHFRTQRETVIVARCRSNFRIDLIHHV